jgi:hypothetical protein
MLDLEKEYSQRVNRSQLIIARLTRSLRMLSLLRLGFFVLTLASPFLFFEISLLLTILVSVIAFSLFLFLVKWYQTLSLRRKFEQIKVEINLREQKALQHQFSDFSDGSEFIDPHHMNSYDLDLFGKGSLFQFLNRTVTPKGAQKLAHVLQHPMLDIKQILERQELINELKEEIVWRQNFSAEGKMYGEDKTENELFVQWSEQEFTLRSLKIAPVLLVVLPIVGIASIIFWIVTGNSALFIFSLFLQAAWWIYESKQIIIIYSQFGKRANILQKYASLLKYIETFQWNSAEGKQIIQKLKHDGLPSVEAKKLSKIISAFDNRNNLLMGVFLNLILVWDIWNSYRLVNWHRRNKMNYRCWIETIAMIDACNSLANYAYNHPEAVYPKFSDGEFHLKAEQLGHPLIHPRKRVCNNFELNGTHQTIIITGANMSGKSTFLRTIGVNMVMGMSGAPVCAQRMVFKPVEVFSNMRTSDSLFDDESYFFAELKRLKAILEEVDKGKELLIILDEILKGTNSVDKLYGSQKLLRRLIDQKTSAIIATHDLKLTEIEHEFPDKVSNLCFEITIDNDEMQFDYQLRRGVTTIMNASFLMKKMGIIR